MSIKNGCTIKENLKQIEMMQNRQIEIECGYVIFDALLFLLDKFRLSITNYLH